MRDYKIKDHQDFVDRVHEYFIMMKQSEFEKRRPYPDQQDFWYRYGQVKRSIEDYCKKHSQFRLKAW